MKIRYRPTALRQIEQIFTHIAAESPASARTVVGRIKYSIDRLALLPYSGRPSEVEAIRELPVVRYPYIVFYSVDTTADEVIILRVRHTSRDPKHRLD